VIWANVAAHAYHGFAEYDFGTTPEFLGSHHVTVHYLVNDVLMYLFFFLVILEMRRDLLRGGDLGAWRARFSTLFATLGGVLVPFAIYKYLAYKYVPWITEGFAIPMATDIVFANLVARIVFGRGNHPAKVFLRALAILDDLITTLVIAVFYGDDVDWLGLLPWALSLLMLTAFMNAHGVRNKYTYMVLSVPAWVMFSHFGVHTAIAAIVFAWFIPHGKSAEQNFFPGPHCWTPDARDEVLENIEHWLRRGVVPLTLMAFGLVNGGIAIGLGGSTTYIVLAGLLIGKPVGIVLGTLIGALVGFGRPDGVSWRDVLIVGFAASIGFTVSIFVADIALEDPTFLSHAKLGATMSFIGGAIAILIGKVTRNDAELDSSAVASH